MVDGIHVASSHVDGIYDDFGFITRASQIFPSIP
jgi:hypothetical protein